MRGQFMFPWRIRLNQSRNVLFSALTELMRKTLRQKVRMVFLQPLEHSLPHFFYETNQLFGIIIRNRADAVVLSGVALATAGIEIIRVVFLFVAQNEWKRGDSPIMSKLLLG